MGFRARPFEVYIVFLVSWCVYAFIVGGGTRVPWYACMCLGTPCWTQFYPSTMKFPEAWTCFSGFAERAFTPWPISVTLVPSWVLVWVPLWKGSAFSDRNDVRDELFFLIVLERFSPPLWRRQSKAVQVVARSGWQRLFTSQHTKKQRVTGIICS